MRLMSFLCLLLILTACAVPLQSILLEREARATALPRLAVATAIPASQPTQGQVDKPTEVAAPVQASPIAPARAEPTTTTVPRPQPTPVPAQQGVLIVRWGHFGRGASLALVDPHTGLDLPGYEPIDLGPHAEAIPSPDGRTVAMITYRSNSSGRGGMLNVLDTGAWSLRETGVTVDGWANGRALSPDGTRLAIGYSMGLGYVKDFRHVLATVNLATGESNQIGFSFSPTMIAYTPDGESLLVYGRYVETHQDINAVPRVAILDAADLSVKWEQALPGVMNGIYAPHSDLAVYENPDAIWWYPALAFAHDRSALYIVHADEDKLTTVDFEALKVSTVAIEPPRSWLDRLMALTAGVAHAKVWNGTAKHAVLSPDGQRLYVVGLSNTTVQVSANQSEGRQETLGLKVVGAATGEVLSQADTDASEIQMAPDGRHLFLRGWLSQHNWSEVWEIESLKRVRRFEDKQITAVRQLDGTSLLFAMSHKTYTLLDPETYTESDPWFLEGYASGQLIAAP